MTLERGQAERVAAGIAAEPTPGRVERPMWGGAYDSGPDAPGPAPVGPKGEPLRSGSVPGLAGDPWAQRAQHDRIAAEIAGEDAGAVDLRPTWERER